MAESAREASNPWVMIATSRKLHERNLLKCPRWMPDNMCYETVMGSLAYGVSSDLSDVDVYGFCIPPKELVFPHLAGEIPGFGRQIQRFEQYQQHHIDDPSVKDRCYDVQVFSIVKFFHLCMENNPNALDCLFTPIDCVTQCSRIGQMVREHRRDFLHKGSWHRFKGYAYSQMHKMDNKKPIGKRKATIETHGYDVKFAYHVVRLINEAEQILIEGDIDLRRDAELLKSIRRGEWTQQQIRDYFQAKESTLDRAYVESKLQHEPDEPKLKRLLLDCLEAHYGDLSAAVATPGRDRDTLREIRAILDRAGI